MSEFSKEGGCLCGAVRFSCTAKAPVVGMCHCKMCRRWAGGLPLTVLHASVMLHDDASLKWWQSSGWGERGFCAACGSSLFWRLRSGADSMWEVSAGALDDDSGLSIEDHIFYDEKATYYETTDDAPRLGGAEFMAKTLRHLAAEHGEAAVAGAIAMMRAQSGEAFADRVQQLMAESG